MKIFHELFFVSTLMAYYHYADLGICPKSRDGNGVGQGRRMGSLFSPCMVLSCPALHDGENFLAPSLLLGALRSSILSHKTLLLVNLPHIYYKFF